MSVQSNTKVQESGCILLFRNRGRFVGGTVETLTFQGKAAGSPAFGVQLSVTGLTQFQGQPFGRVNPFSVTDSFVSVGTICRRMSLCNLVTLRATPFYAECVQYPISIT